MKLQRLGLVLSLLLTVAANAQVQSPTDKSGAVSTPPADELGIIAEQQQQILTRRVAEP